MPDRTRPARTFFSRLRGYVQRRSLMFLLSLSFTLAAVIIMSALTWFLTSRYSALNKNQLAADSERLASQISVNLDTVLRNALRFSENVHYRVLKQDDANDAAMRSNLRLLLDMNADLVSSISVFSFDGELLYAEPYQRLNTFIQAKDEPWFENAVTTIENTHFSTPHVQRIFVSQDDKADWVISLSRAVSLTELGRVYEGVLLVDLQYQVIEQMFRHINMSEPAYIYLTDKDANIIYHPRQQLIYSGLYEESNAADANAEDGVHERTDGTPRLVTVKTVGYTGWKIVLVQPLTGQAYGFGELQAFSILFAIVAIFLIVFINMLISERIARPIKSLESRIGAYERGESPTFSPDPTTTPEIDHLGQAIAQLVEQEAELRANIVTEQESKRKSELLALQAQIHPHFLYNTLDSIIWMIENERYDGSVEMVTALAKFFRLSLAKGRELITVEDELNHIRNYLTIQNVRYRDRFTSSIRLEPEAAGCETIKLVVQPLVENAIYHGTDAQEESHIDVHAYVEGDSVFIDVNDNGYGMTEAQIKDVLSREPAGISKHGSGIGLSNVNARIKLHYGDAYGLSILSKPDEGTRVRIHLPKRPYKEVQA